MNDTPPEIAKMVHDRLMALSGAERFMMGVASFEAARKIMIASFPPNLLPREFKRLLYQRTYGEPPPDDFPTK